MVTIDTGVKEKKLFENVNSCDLETKGKAIPKTLRLICFQFLG